MDIVKSKDDRYGQYEKLLLERDSCRRRAKLYLQAYLREFGKLMTDSFQKKISCIEKKKAIAFCQACVNRGESVDRNALRRYLTVEMAEYNKRLQEMIRDNEACKSLGRVCESDLMKIRRVYRKLAKKIHPDIFPAAAENDNLRELWNRVVDAYNRNDLKEITELEIIILKALEDEGWNYDFINVPDLEYKIAELEREINTIISTDPYRYKDLLEDDALIAEKKDELQKEIEESAAYEEELQSILETFLMIGAIIQWEN